MPEILADGDPHSADRRIESLDTISPGKEAAFVKECVGGKINFVMHMEHFTLGEICTSDKKSVAVVFIDATTVRLKWLVVPLAIMAFGTNVLHGGPLSGVDNTTYFSKIIAQGRFRSTIVEFIGELMTPPPSAYRRTARWIEENITEKQSVVVLPSFASYPLMYNAPHPLYAWQLKEKTPQFQSLPDIHFYGLRPPQFMIAFGPHLQKAKRWLRNLEAKGLDYERVEILDIYWYDLIRPELFWHAFKEIRNYSAEDQAIYIFQRKNEWRKMKL